MHSTKSRTHVSFFVGLGPVGLPDRTRYISIECIWDFQKYLVSKIQKFDWHLDWGSGAAALLSRIMQT